MDRPRLPSFLRLTPKAVPVLGGVQAYALAQPYGPLLFSTYGPGIPVARSFAPLEGAGYSAGQTLRDTDLYGDGNVQANSLALQMLLAQAPTDSAST